MLKLINRQVEVSFFTAFVLDKKQAEIKKKSIILLIKYFISKNTEEKNIR
jgi:hypothetical protein